MFAEINAAIQSVKPLFDLVRAAKGISNSTEILMAVSEVQQRLMDANAAALASQEKQAVIAERVHELETQLRDIKDWNSKIERYTLVQLPTGALAHQLKVEMANGEPMHYVCTACVDKGKKTRLQPRNYALHCPDCKSDILAQQPPPFPPMTFEPLA